MKKSVVVLGLIIISVFIASVNANAETVSFGDTSRFWPGWSNGSGDDSHDVIGIPNFTGGQASVVSDRLINLTFNRAVGTNPNWGVLSAGDLFVDVGADQVWDYVVDLSNWSSSGPNVSDPGPGSYNIYAISLALNDRSGGYILSGSDGTGDWSGYGVRDGHPVAANVGGEPYGSADFSGWGNDSITQYSFDFHQSLGLGHSGKFIIGWQPNCANDVVYETLNYHAAPEPATMSLLGLGLAGLLRFRKRKA